MNKLLYSILMVWLLFLAACNPQPEAALLLNQAESIVETYPDSALLLVDSIFYPEKSLKRKAYMRYLVTQVQAKYKTYRPIDGDTLVFLARDYFSGQGRDSRMAALAWFYSGCVFSEQMKYTEAMRHYGKAGEYAAQTGDTDLQGLVRYNTGELFAEQGLYKEALEHYKESAQLYGNKPGKQTQCLSAIGRMHTILQQPDSALRYFLKGLEIAESGGDRESQSLLSQNLSVAYNNAKQFDKAEAYLRQSYLLNADSAEIPRYYLNFASLYDGMGRHDSAAIYTEKLLSCIDAAKDNHLKASAYSYLAGWEKARADYGAAFAYQDAQMKTLLHIMEERGNQLIYEANRKYDYEKMRKQYYMDISKKQFWIIALLAIFMGSGIFIAWYFTRQRKRSMEAQRIIDTLYNMNCELENTLNHKQLELRKNLQWRLNISRGTLVLNSELKNSNMTKTNSSIEIGQFNEIVYGKKNIDNVWDTFLETINVAQPGVTEKIMERYPNLTKKEFRITLLYYAGFTVKESSLILSQSPNTIQTRRSEIRKKMGLDFRDDFASHIDQL